MLNRDHKQTLARVCGTIVTLTAMAAMPAAAAENASQPQRDPFAQMHIVGPANQPELIVPVEIPDWAANLGITGAERVYKGICGPNGAAISVNELFRAAEQDLQMQHVNRGTMTTEVVGESPAFAMTYDQTDAVLVALFLPSVRRAIGYVDGQLDNRVQIGATFATGTFSGDTIGSAGSTRFTIPWSVYVEGLRSQSIRDDSRFANGLPNTMVNVLYDGSTSSTAESEIRVTDAQLRAIFGDTAVPQGQGVSITFNSSTAWNYFGCDIGPSGDQESLIDVAVHELTHSLGFTSGIAEGGGNSTNQIQGLDVARFRAGNLPVSSSTFMNNPRLGEQFTSEIHFYSSFPTGTSTLLESGDNNQPSHLNFVSDPDGKLGVMDPVINRGTTRCPDFYSANDLQPLDDMGWRPIAINAVQDCNSNGQLDVIDIAIGISSDNDGDGIPDECESFKPGLSNPGLSNGIVRTIWEAPGVTALNFFDPNSPSVIPVASQVVSDPSESLSFGNSNTRVVEYDGFIFAPATDEYAFRVEHTNDMYLLIDDIVIEQSTHAERFTRTDSSTQIAKQSFFQLQQGWHRITLQYLIDTPTSLVGLIRESRSIGSWEYVGSGDLQIDDQFSDCDQNGTNDFVDVYDDLGNRIDLGSVGESNTPIQFDTSGSSFDTEMALWDDSGTLIDMNDDNPQGGRQSIITQSLSAGQYILAVNGYNSVYSSGPGLEFVNGCSDSGAYHLNITGSEVISGSIPAGRVHVFTFTIGDADCDADGTPDAQEFDCDGDGIPDDCQIQTVADAGDAGVVGDSSQAITISTCGSDFDTEIALWDENGMLIDQDDDSPCGLASEITASLAPGFYYLAFAGYDAVFADNFGITINANGECSEGGSLSASIGDLSDTTTLDPGRVILIRFEVAELSGCNGADLNMDGMLNFFDVSQFLTAFNAHDPIADFNNDGQFNFFDVSAFLGLFAQGCP